MPEPGDEWAAGEVPINPPEPSDEVTNAASLAFRGEAYVMAHRNGWETCYNGWVIWSGNGSESFQTALDVAHLPRSTLDRLRHARYDLGQTIGLGKYEMNGLRAMLNREAEEEAAQDKRRRDLITAACEAQEQIDIDELERSAAEQRRREEGKP